jgi:hypothetical protein
MSLFSAKLLFVATIDGKAPRGALVEESIRVFRASDAADAAKRADEIGRTSVHEYKNDAGQTVQWAFVRTLELQDLCEQTLDDGAEVFSTLRQIRPSDVRRGKGKAAGPGIET